MDQRARLECQDCNMVYTVEMLNLVDAHGEERKGPVSNHCPNCASEDLEPWVPGEDLIEYS